MVSFVFIHLYIHLSRQKCKIFLAQRERRHFPLKIEKIIFSPTSWPFQFSGNTAGENC